MYPNEFFKICSAVEVILSIFFYKNHYNAQKMLEKVSVIWYCELTSPEWWNGRHERLKIFCQRWRKSSSLFSGRWTSDFRKSFFFNDRYSSGTNDAHNLCKSMASCIWVASIWGDWSRSAMVRAVLMQLEMARGEKL